jgi:L-threonylcarbamoyladenylate synthase
MVIISKQEYLANKEGYISMIKSGSIFIYPTDTIYGIGCNAILNAKVKKIRDIKLRPTSPFSLIIPNKEWIYQNCIVTPESEEWIAKLPGPYTLIFKLKDSNFLSKEICDGSVGVRIPDHWISELVHTLGYPIITTSVNHAGRQFMTSLETLDPQIQKQVDLIIEEGEIKGKPSKIVKFTDMPQVIRE